jgi:hypothetical protein
MQEVEFDCRLNISFNSSQGDLSLHSKLNELIGRTNAKAVQTLDNLLKLISSTSIDDLLNEKNILLQLIEKEWEDELMLEMELADLQKQYSTHGLVM